MTTKLLLTCIAPKKLLFIGILNYLYSILCMFIHNCIIINIIQLIAFKVRGTVVSDGALQVLNLRRPAQISQQSID